MLKELKLVQDTMDSLEHIRIEKITRDLLSEKEANKEFAEETFKLEQLKLNNLFKIKFKGGTNPYYAYSK